MTQSTISMQVLPFFYWYVPFTHIMSRKCRKLQLRVLVGRFGSQNAMVGRLDDLGAGRRQIGLKSLFSGGERRRGHDLRSSCIGAMLENICCCMKPSCWLSITCFQSVSFLMQEIDWSIIWLFSRMKVFMCLQVLSLPERFVALVTDKGLSSSMIPFVNI